MSEDQRVRIIMGVASLEELSTMRKNVTDRSGLTSQLNDAFKQREFELFQQKMADRLQRSLNSLTPLELRIVRGLAALWMTHEKHLPPNRSIQALRNRGGDLIRFAEDVVSNGLESSGYRRLNAAGFDDLVFERVVLDHSEVFSQKARDNARRRLQVLEQASVEHAIVLDDGEQGLGEEAFLTNTMLEAIGFGKPHPTAWYAIRSNEIVFLSWVKEADFECGVARILADEEDTRPNFFHWRSQIQKIKAGDYRNAYIVFGYKGPDYANIQHSPELRLYAMKEIRQVDAEIFAVFVAAEPFSFDDADRSVETGTDEEQSGRSMQVTTVPVRPEQAAFRRALFERFNGRCALTGCTVAQLLDAAHLPGRDWALGHNTADDGVLLRTDLHRALDNGLIRLDDDLKVTWVDAAVMDLYGTLLSSI